MDIGLLQVLTRSQINQLLRSVQDAFDEHVRLACRCQSVLLSASEPDAVLLDENSHLYCNFGSWYHGDIPKGLKDSEEFARLGEIHRRFHHASRKAVTAKLKNGSLTIELSEFLLTSQSDLLLAFNQYLREVSEGDQLFDPLTGLLNRKEMHKLLRREISRAKRSGTSTSIAIADLDFFKSVNDIHGHEAGDSVLREAATNFSSNLRPYDLLFRLGGEEFLFCFPETDLGVSGAVCERMRESVEKMRVSVAKGKLVSITASFGVSPLAPDIDVDESIRNADRALYKAKSEGRNRVFVSRGQNGDCSPSKRPPGGSPNPARQ